MKNVFVLLLVAVASFSGCNSPGALGPGKAEYAKNTVERSTSNWKAIAPGLEMRRWSVRASNYEIPIVAVRGDISRFGVSAGRVSDAETWRGRLRVPVVINGGFFDEENRSLGLRVAKGKTLTDVRNADWGVFYVRTSKKKSGLEAHILHTRDFKKLPGSLRSRVREAVQCGPRLVVEGKVLTFKEQWGRRTGIGITRDGRVVLAISEGEMTLRDWAILWNSRSGMNCADALNLDGGGSTQIAIKTSRENYEVGGAWPVPDVVYLR